MPADLGGRREPYPHPSRVTPTGPGHVTGLQPAVECTCTHVSGEHEDGGDGQCQSPLYDSLGTRYGYCDCLEYMESAAS